MAAVATRVAVVAPGVVPGVEATTSFKKIALTVALGRGVGVFVFVFVF